MNAFLPSPLDPSLLLRNLCEGLRADEEGHTRLEELLEQQFQAALRHETARMTALSDEVLAQVETLERQRDAQRRLLGLLLGRQERPTLRALIRRLPPASAEPLARQWQALQSGINRCKTLNLRNCRLLSEQRALMQQQLGQEEHLYAQR